jgi:hypothetical protein
MSNHLHHLHYEALALRLLLAKLTGYQGHGDPDADDYTVSTEPYDAARQHIAGPRRLRRMLACHQRTQPQGGGHRMTAACPMPDDTMSPEEARDLTDRIKTNLDHMWELMVEAFVRQAWRALNYPCWDAWRTEEFGQCRIKLPREQHREVICSLREQGLSLRQIESVSGISRPTIIKNLHQAQGGEVVNFLPPHGPPKPKPDTFVSRFNRHLINLQKAAFGLQDGMRAPDFGEHLAQLYRATHENVVFAQELLDKAYAQLTANQLDPLTTDLTEELLP